MQLLAKASLKVNLEVLTDVGTVENVSDLTAKYHDANRWAATYQGVLTRSFGGHTGSR